MKRLAIVTATLAGALVAYAPAAHASEAALTVTADCSGVVTATVVVVSEDGTTGRIDGWWGAALGQPTTSPVQFTAPNGAQVTVGVNMTLSTGAPSSDVVTITVPAPCPATTTTTTVAPEPTTTVAPDPTTTTVVVDPEPTTTTTAAPTDDTRPTVPGYRPRPSSSTTNPYADCATGVLVTFDDRQPGDLPISGSPWYCRRTSLPRTGGNPGTLAAVAGLLLGAGLAARWVSRRPVRS